MAKNFKDLRAKMSPEARKRVEEKTKKMILESRLREAMNYMAINNYSYSVTLTYHEADILVELLKKDLQG